MWKKIMIVLLVLVTSMFYFPFEFSFLPGLNTKKLLAAFGLALFFINLARKKKSDLPWPFLFLLGFAGVVSIVGMYSLSYNGTNDTAYSSYFTSAAVWLGAAYLVCKAIQGLHGWLTMPLLIRYLIAACVFQCVMALLIDNVPAVRAVVDAYVQQGQDMLKDMDRLYGIGAALDVAGSRFSAVLIMLAFLLRNEQKEGQYASVVILFTSFLLITVIGSMVARTTYVGVILAMGVIALDKQFWSPVMSRSSFRSFLVMLLILVLLIVLAVVLYNTNVRFNKLFRFAFEGFFNLFESGEYSLDSTSKLETMYVWPDNLKTWIIGDGYFTNPRGDINYVGNTTREGYYMGTDVGYCRFIFYFGIVGLLAISAVIAYAAFSSAKRLPKYRVPILLVLLANFVIWLKVSTDLFPALALIFCVAMLVGEDDEAEDEENGSEEALE